MLPVKPAYFITFTTTEPTINQVCYKFRSRLRVCVRMRACMCVFVSSFSSCSWSPRSQQQLIFMLRTSRSRVVLWLMLEMLFCSQTEMEQRSLYRRNLFVELQKDIRECVTKDFKNYFHPSSSPKQTGLSWVWSRFRKIVCIFGALSLFIIPLPYPTPPSVYAKSFSFVLYGPGCRISYVWQWHSAPNVSDWTRAQHYFIAVRNNGRNKCTALLTCWGACTEKSQLGGQAV